MEDRSLRKCPLRAGGRTDAMSKAEVYSKSLPLRVTVTGSGQKLKGNCLFKNPPAGTGADGSAVKRPCCSYR